MYLSIVYISRSENVGSKFGNGMYQFTYTLTVCENVYSDINHLNLPIGGKISHYFKIQVIDH